MRCSLCDDTGYIIGAGSACSCGILEITRLRTTITEQAEKLAAAERERDEALAKVKELEGDIMTDDDLCAILEMPEGQPRTLHTVESLAAKRMSELHTAIARVRDLEAQVSELKGGDDD